MTAPCGLFTGMSLALSVYESKQRGDDYYRSLMNGPWFSGNARRYFLYACDIVIFTFLTYKFLKF